MVLLVSAEQIIFRLSHLIVGNYHRALFNPTAYAFVVVIKAKVWKVCVVIKQKALI